MSIKDKYKDKGDIPYVKMLEFYEDIKDKDDEAFIASKVIEHFYPEHEDSKDICLELFSKAISTPSKKRFKYVLSMDFKKASEWIDADTFNNDKRMPDLLKQILKPLYFWQKFNINKLSLHDANIALESFTKGRVKSNKSMNIFITRPYRQILGI